MSRQSYPKTQENLRLNTRHLKGITVEQLFIISMQTDYPELNSFKGRLSRFVHSLFLLPNQLITNIDSRLFLFGFLNYLSFYFFSKINHT
jgi:hypothetical protein